MNNDQSKEAADRRRGLLKITCSQERAVSYFDKPWCKFCSNIDMAKLNALCSKIDMAKLNAIVLFV
jgi:hypothetical protein